MSKFFIIYPIVFVVLFTSNLKGQPKLENNILGSWVALKVYKMDGPVPKGPKSQLEMVQKQILGSKFEFKKDHHFNLESSFFKIPMKNKHWKISNVPGQIIVQEWEDKDKAKPVLMYITVMEKEGKMIFIVEEIFLAFEMKKIAGNK